MTKAIASFTSCPNKLNQLLVTLQSENEQLRLQVETLTQEKELLDALLKQAHQARFSRKTERFDITQLSLLDEDMDVDISTLETKLASPLIDVPSKKDSPRRQTLPESLPREEIRLEPDSLCCPDCGQPLRFVRDEINEVLDYIPGKFIVRKTIRPQYSCGGCQTIHSAQLPAQLIDKGQVAPGLLAQIVINKCVDHLPLYRQQKIFNRAGIDLPISTLCDWMGKTGVALEPLINRMHELLLEQKVLHADETPLTLLSAKKGKSTRGYLWAYATPATAKKRMVMFDCQPGRSAQYVKTFLGNYSGTLMVDDYAGYKGLFVSGQIKEAGCLAHVRRKFFEQYQTNQNPLAKTALDSIGELYKLERLIKERPPDKKYRWRNRYAKPILDTLHNWLELQQRQTAPRLRTH